MERLDADAVDDLLGRIGHEIETGRVPAAQVALGLEGEIVLHEAFGCAPDALLPMYSTSKVLAVAAVWRLLGAGGLAVDTPAVEVLPWFTGGGKDAIRLHHLLEHTAGISTAPLGAPDWFTPEGRQAKMRTWYTTSAPGEVFDYHATSAHWVLAEMLSALHGGRDHTEVIHELVTEPMGLPRVLGVDDTEVEVIDLVPVHPEGGDAHDALADAVAELTDDNLLRFNDHDVRLLGVPAGGGLATAADIALLYQHLLHDPHRLFDPAILRLGTREIRVTMDDPLRMSPANRSLGLIVAGDDGRETMRGFGQGVSPHAFGHDGAGGQLGFADPASGLSVCFLNNALDDDVIRQFRRSISVAGKAVACVGSSVP